MNRTKKRNHNVHVIGQKSKRVVVHIENGTMSLDQAARLALDVVKAVDDASPRQPKRAPDAVD